jgi:phage baseplate assembly protein gpV
VDDPDGAGRVRVKLPTFGDVETDWLGVLCIAAGSGKGLIALPDVDDQVLVLSLDGDPGRGFVLGGLYGTTELPDTGVEGSAVKRYTLVTPGGQLVRLDDDKHLMRLETSSGNFVELAPGMLLLHSTGNLTIEAPGRNVLVRAAAIDFETA